MKDKTMQTYITTCAGRQRPILNCAGAYIESITGQNGEELNASQVQLFYTTAELTSRVSNVFPTKGFVHKELAVGQIWWLPFDGKVVPARATAFRLEVLTGQHSGFVKMLVQPAHPFIAEYASTLAAPLNQFFKVANHA